MHVHCTALPLMKVESWKGKLLFRLHNTVCTATWLIHCKALHSLQDWSAVVLLGGIHYTGVQVSWWEGGIQYGGSAVILLGGIQHYGVQLWEDYNMVGVQLWEESAL